MNTVTRNIPVERALASGLSPAFAIREISVLVHAGGFTLWHYRAGAAPLDDVAAPGFFDAIGDMFAVGDMVLVSAADGGRVLFVTGCDGRVTTGSLT